MQDVNGYRVPTVSQGPQPLRLRCAAAIKMAVMINLLRSPSFAALPRRCAEWLRTCEFFGFSCLFYVPQIAHFAFWL
jgi:hypothetical protein